MRTPFFLLLVVPSMAMAQSSVPELGSASDKAQGVHDDNGLLPAPAAGSSENEAFNLAMVEEQPQFPGGEKAMMDYLAKNIRYPQEASEDGLQGKVFLEFIVRADGVVGDVRALRSPSGSLSAEAVRVVKAMPTWSPGKMNGKPVSVRYVLPVNFVLAADEAPVKER